MEREKCKKKIEEKIVKLMTIAIQLFLTGRCEVQEEIQMPYHHFTSFLSDFFP
jgi:hypothetical protein